VLATQQWELARFRKGGRTWDAWATEDLRAPAWPPFQALALADAGDHAGAAAALAAFELGFELRPGVRSSNDAWPLVVSAEAVAAAGSDAQRADVYRRLVPLAGTHVVVAGFVAHAGAVDHYLGLLAAALGRPEAAAAHFEAATALHARVGAHAWAELDRERLRRLQPPAEAGAAAGNVFRRDGDVWTLGHAGSLVHLADAKGLRDIAVLLASPGRSVPALELLAGRPVPDGGADPVLDDRARAAYRARLAELEAELDDAEDAADLHRAERARAERDALVDELARATGLGGRPRRLGDERERARKAVTARVRDALGRIEQAHPSLGRHLRETISTGTSCAYAPAAPVDWEL
jgi:hypothetical protein